MLELKNITIALHGKLLVNDFSLKIEKGEIITFTGASGVGKSSFLGYIVGALQPPFEASGEIILGGRLLNPLPIHKRAVGVLFQDALLFPHLCVRENLEFAMPAGLKKNQRRECVFQALKDCDMEGFQESDPASLSGGQKARIALMRALLAEPQSLLLDEPFSKLDPALRGTLREFVFEHIRKYQLPAILVTHDEADARASGGKKFSLPLL